MLKKIILVLIGIYFSQGIILAQKIDFSVYLASGDEVYSKSSAVSDKKGNIFVVGGTRSGLRVTADAYQKKYKGNDSSGGGDLFLMKLSSSGELIYSTYIGGSGTEYLCQKITLDNSGNLYIACTTYSKDLQVSENAYQKTHNNKRDYYIIKFSNDCKYLASTYLGGSDDELFPELYIHNNRLYLTGRTNSKDFPTTSGVIQEKYNKQDVSITALSLDLDKVLYSSYLGGKARDSVTSCTFDKKGNMILSGSSSSDDYPTTKRAFQQSLNGKKTDGFVTIINPTLSKIIYSTFIGGSSDDAVNSIVRYDSNHLILIGNTKSSDFPVTKDALNGKFMGGGNDGFIMKLNISANKLEYSSFLGGSGNDEFCYITKTNNEKFVLVGETNSKDFPLTKNAMDQTLNGPVEKTHSSGWFSLSEDEIHYEGEEDLSLLILDKSLKIIEYSTYIGGSRDDGWQKMLTANLIDNNQLLISTLSDSPDFPVTHSFAAFPGAPRITLLKINLNSK